MLSLISEIWQVFSWFTQLILVGEKRIIRELAQQDKEEEFLKWLSPSHWLVEGQLQALLSQRDDGTLDWALEMTEFNNWQNAEFGSKESVLWIRGGPGIGKSTMAGYFIRHLKDTHPDSAVTYFFCTNGRPGLMNVRDIIRTLAYQFCLDSAEARSALDELRKTHFGIDQNIGIRFLFTKLLQEPLQQMAKDWFLVLDGLDEADSAAQDVVELRPEIDIFLNCLIRLPFARILMLSRPDCTACDNISWSTTRSLQFYENADDIRIYAQNEISEAKAIQRWFPAELNNPVDYFVNNSRGIFLWVVLSLRQLSGSKSRKVFHDCLSGISNAGGNMDTLYSAILSRLSTEDWRWIEEILRWLISADKSLAIDELKAAVYWSLGDELDDFEKFLNDQCGSIVQIISNNPIGSSVQLIHETFRSFLVSPIRCPAQFYIDEESVKAYATLTSLQFICGENPESDDFIHYAAPALVNHLSVSRGKQACAILRGLHDLFTSDGLLMFVKYGLLPKDNLGDQTLYVDFEEEAIKSISKWLTEWQRRSDVEEKTELVDSSLKWREEIMGNPGLLGELIGRAAANLWLFGTLLDYNAIAASFRLALKYYRKTTNRLKSNAEELQDLISSEFGTYIDLAWDNTSS